MNSITLVMVAALIFGVGAYYLGHNRAMSIVQGKVRGLHSLPSYYGLYVAIWCIAPALFLIGLWLAVESTVVTNLMVSHLPQELVREDTGQMGLMVNDIKNLAEGNITSSVATAEMQAAADDLNRLTMISRIAMILVAFGLAATMGWLALTRVRPEQRARNAVENIILAFLVICASIAILTTLGIVLSVLFESVRFFGSVPITEFMFGTSWSPQMAIRADQVGSSGSFGAIPLFAGTMLISAVALFVAVPIGLLAAIYLSEYAGSKVRATAKPVLEILAGIPTVVYGFFAALVVAPFVRDFGASIGLTVASESALAAGLVMGIMIIPFVSSLSDDVINAVPQSLRDGAYALGATQAETVRKVIFPAALPGIIGGILLAASRAIGETMIVVMAAGLMANLTANPLDAVTTVTVQIVTLLTGDQEFDSPKTLAAFALGLMLFVTTLILNVIALHIVRKYREQYD